ncbi:bifunctional oligoribonuclease and PAP phosphatase NrnA [bacterium BMS3Abin15]|nr:bifunctional oligoribonuclease and PAP phosphatase NrnA [bacterium BMS3Abin15]HDH07752.1 hypothetical protein [Candidatus Moranbacteria bacterium]HDZ85444.1 hypothetical protein [Candidatus Moranbacteria bacterium]
MALEPIQQFEKIIGKSKNVLILLPQNPDGDAIGAAWAFYFFLKKRGVDTTIAFSDGIHNTKKFDFLPRPKNITDNISGARDFILSFGTRHNKILGARTESDEEEFRIYVTPEHGSIDPRDFSFVPASFKFDLVVTFNCPDKESTGKIYEENPDIFYEIPVVNIDHHSNNENFGQINLVNMNSSSASEILAEIFEQSSLFSFDKVTANCLLSGIISATESFQKKNTTPKALQIAAKLMDKGADQQKIIRYLYKTQPFHVLKLWGRVMARLKWNDELKLAWSPVYIEDFVQSRSSHHDIPRILEKIQDNYSTGKMFLIFFNDTPDSVRGIIKFTEDEHIKKITSILKGETRGNIHEFKLEDGDINKAEKEVLEKIRLGIKK